LQFYISAFKILFMQFATSLAAILYVIDFIYKYIKISVISNFVAIAQMLLEFDQTH